MPDECIFNGEWERRRIEAYSSSVEQRQGKLDLSVKYSPHHKGYLCPHCGQFADKSIDVVTRHSIHCRETTVSRDPRGWWPNVRR